MRASVLLAVASLLLVLPAEAQTPAPPGINTADHADHGTYLADRTGMALYLFEEDRREGERGRSVESDCEGECLERWPPLLAPSTPVAGGAADAGLVDSFERPDGAVQATYNGWPLYYFAEDFVPGDINGHDFEEFGGEWYLVTPDGWALGEEEDDSTRR